jgi:hypothetical protein
MALTVQGLRADNRGMSSSRPVRASGSRPRESGQGAVEFALLLPVFIILVAGIIKFGIAINFWLDMQRIANQGARWAAVNGYPGCPAGSSSCSQTLQQYLDAQKLANGEVIVTCVSFPSGTSNIGDPVKVSMSRRLGLGIPFVPLGVTISGSATMRVEQAINNPGISAACQ